MYNQTPYVYVQFIDDPNAINVGRRSKSGDMIGYDGNGNLLFYVQVTQTSPYVHVPGKPLT
jgi:hypothetical protein